MDHVALTKLSQLIRYYILLMTHAAHSGHVNSSLSAVELATVLFFKHFRFDLDNPQNITNDRFILSKGHASPLFYALYTAVGKITQDELLKYRSLESNLEGHPTIRFPYTEALTGSLGQGLSIGVGMALALRARVLNSKFKVQSIPQVYVLLGDGEMAEGQIWEAIAYASYRKVNNLTGIIDVNRLSQSEQTMYGHDISVFADRVSSFNWRTYVVEDGHDLKAVDAAYEKAIQESENSEKPAMIIAKTIKGKGVPFWEDKNGWHSKELPEEEYVKIMDEWKGIDKTVRGVIERPKSIMNDELGMMNHGKSIIENPHYKKEEKVATKKAFGNALEKLGSQMPQLVVFDGDMKNSTHIDQFEKKFPDRFYQSFIAEQNMVSMAWGMALRGYMPLVCTFACFLTRAHDQLRLAALSDVTFYICGAYAGVSLGKDGPSQMALEDMAMIRPMLGSIVLYPSDAVSTEKLTVNMFHEKGIVYLKTTREPTPLIYDEKEEFPIGGSKEFRIQNSKNEITIVASGITVHEALKAQKEMHNQGTEVRVIDCYSIKPIDSEALKKAAQDSKAIITVEDHYAVGGLGDAVLEALADIPHPPIYKLAVTKTPRSGTPEELLEYEEISAKEIVKICFKLM